MNIKKWKFIIQLFIIMLLLLFFYWEMAYFIPNMAIKSKLSDLGFSISHIEIEHIKNNIYELKNPPLLPDGKQQLKYWELKSSGMYHIFQYAVPLNLQENNNTKNTIFLTLPINDYLNLKNLSDLENKTVENYILDILKENIPISFTQ